MKVITLSVFLAVLLLEGLAELPSIQFAWPLLECIPLGVRCRPLRFPLAIACGFCGRCIRPTLQPGLAPALVGKDIGVPV
jgi:hypothetical protein